MATIKVHSDGYDAFKERVIGHARSLDRGEPLPSGITLTFNSTADLLTALTPKRIALLEMLVDRGETSVAALARASRRSREALLRDLRALDKLGLVYTTGTGASLKARAAATRFELSFSIKRGAERIAA